MSRRTADTGQEANTHAVTPAPPSPVEAADAAVDLAAAQVREERETLQRWQDSLAASEAELAAAEESSGERALKDPEGAVELARDLAQMRETVALRGRAVEAQRPRIPAAERVYLSAQEERVRLDLAAARDDLAAHEGKVETLLEQLRDLEGDFVPLARLRAAQSSAGLEWDDGPVGVYVPPKSDPMRMRVRTLERHVEVLHTMASGVDPASLVASWGGAIWNVSDEEAYPACVREVGALVKAPLFVARVEAQRARVVDIEAAMTELQVEETELAERRGDITEWEAGQFNTRVRHVEARLEEMPGELEAARAELAAMGG